MATILLTGSAGHIGRHLSAELRRRGHDVRGFDLRGVGIDRGDLRNSAAVAAACANVAGIIHLAAVSRVDDAERDPAACHATNVDGTATLLAGAHASVSAPWLIFVSSREVLGPVPAHRPANETSAPSPRNVYAHSKLQAEQLVHDGRQQGLRAVTFRLSNVFGSAHDRPERVMPTFVRQAILGATLHVRGPARAFDFLHVDDTVRGLADAADRMTAGIQLPHTLHLVAGISRSLGEVAQQVVAESRSCSPIVCTEPAGHEVGSFYGSGRLATEVLNWTPQITLEHGLARLVALLRPANQPEVTL